MGEYAPHLSVMTDLCEQLTSASGLPMLTHWLYDCHVKVYPSGRCATGGGSRHTFYTQKARRRALLSAAEQGHKRRVSMLLLFGKDPDQCDANGVTALQLAAKNNHCKIVQKLIKHGCKVDQADNIGRTALFKACLQNCAVCVQTLLAAGADVSVRDHVGNTALIAASNLGHRDIVEILLKNNTAHIDAQNRRLVSALHVATLHGHVTSAELLICAGANPDLVAIDGSTAIIAATKLEQRSSSRTLVNMLLRANCNLAPRGLLIDEGRTYRMSAVEAAFYKGKLSLARLLYRCGSAVTRISRPTDESSESEQLNDLFDLWSQPRSLQGICRIHVRDNIRRKCKPDRLQLPIALTQYLDLEDVIGQTLQT